VEGVRLKYMITVYRWVVVFQLMKFQYSWTKTLFNYVKDDFNYILEVPDEVIDAKTDFILHLDLDD